MTPFLASLLAAERARQRRRLVRAALFAALVAAASVLLLGLSGWFITAAAAAGAGGPIVARAFNYMLPSATIRLLAIVRTGARYGERLASHDAALGALARIRPALFRAIAAAPVTRALSFATGEATARMVQDVDTIETRFVRLSAPWSAVAALGSGVGLTLLGGGAAALATALCLGLLLVAAGLLARRLEAPGRAVQRATGALKEEFAALAEAMAELRCFGLEGWAADRIETRSRALADAQRAQARAHGWFELLHALALGIAATAALLLSAQAGAAIAALAALAAAMTVDGAAPLLRSLAQRGSLREAEARLEALLDTALPAERRATPMSDAPTIELLHPLSCHLAPGMRVALVGPSGIGKTTLVETLLGLREARPGQIRLDGVDVATLPAETLRRCFAWLPQDAMLLSGTVRDNLLLSRPDADDTALWHALHDAVLDERVRALPQGLDSWIGENGARLSGGERRRLALARAYLAEAPWLLLDEPTEGLDRATEDHVINRMTSRLAATGQGLLLVSHRPRPTATCERLLRLDLARGPTAQPGVAA